MSIQNCYIKTKKYLKDVGLDKNISEGRLREMVRQLEVAGADAMTPAEFASKIQDYIESEQKRWYAKKQAQTAIILAKRELALKSITENFTDWKASAEGQKFGKPDGMAVEAFRAWLQGGALRPGIDSNLSVEKMGNGIRSQLRDIFNQAVIGVKDVAASGAIDRDTIQELDALDRAQPLGQSGNQAALEYAKAIKAVRDKIFQLKQANNPFMEQADEYLMRQFHDRARIMEDPSEAGKQRWLDQAMQTFGDRSFPELKPDEKLEVFKEIYDRIADGRWGTVQDQSASDKFINVKGNGGDLMRRMSQSRQLVAKDWKAFYDYQSKFGPKTIAEGMDRVLDSSAKDIATLMKFGPNPQGMYEGLYQRFIQKLSTQKLANGEANPLYNRDQAQALKAAKPDLDAKFRIVQGSQNAPATGQVAKLSQGALTLEYLNKTGGALIRSNQDLGLGGNLLRQMNGDTVFSNAAKLSVEYMKGMMSAGYARENLSKVALFSDAAHKELMRTMGSPDQQPGFLGKMVQKLGSLNLLNRHVDAMRNAMGTVTSNMLADFAGKSHEELSPQFKQGLARYGITAPEWEAMRQATEDYNGHKLMTPEAIHALPDDVVTQYLTDSKQHITEGEPSKQALDYGRSQLSTKLGTLINEHADLASAHPDLRQRAFLYGDTNINQGHGMFWRLMMQFKSAAFTTADVYRRGYFSGQSPKGDFVGVAQHLILGAFLYTLGEYSKQLAAGKTPEDPMTPQFAIKMALGSGFTGAYGDVLLSGLDRPGIDNKAMAVAEGILGPTIGTGVEAAAIGGQYIAQGMGEKAQKNLNSKATSLLIRQIPGQNLFYTKALFDYYLANQLREFMGPGYLSHLEGRTHKTQALGGGNQQYMFAKPTGRDFFTGD